MICLNCRFWEELEHGDFDHFFYTSEMPSYLFRPRGDCKRECIVTCYDEGCERFENKFQGVDG